MASKIGEVLDIESADSYMKRPAGPMVTVETKNITKLASYIRIPFMAEGASIMDTIRQRIFYSGLLNQCRKCRKFGHLARACNTNINKPQGSLAQGNPRPRTEARKQEAPRQSTHPPSPREQSGSSSKRNRRPLRHGEDQSTARSKAPIDPHRN